MRTKNQARKKNIAPVDEAESNQNETADTEVKKVSFSNDTVDNANDEPPTKKSKKEKDDVVIETREPTTEELEECNKPENKKAVVSKREIKRKKHEELKAQQKIESNIVARENNLNYLSLWKHSKSEWKFAKVRQMWLQKHMFDSDMIPNENFNTLIEYFAGAKGQIKQVIVKECMDIIEKSEKTETTEKEEESEEEKCKYKRARNMLQSLEE